MNATRSSTLSAASFPSAAASDPALARRSYRVPRRLVHGLLAALVLGVLLLFFGRVPLLRAAGAYLILPERLPERADAIVVLGGGGANGNREAEAARLYRAGIAPLVLTTGGPVPGEDAPATYAEWSVQRLVRRGVPRAAVQPTNEGVSTIGDARGTLRMARQNGWRALVFVTDSWHTRRTQMLFEGVFAGSGVDLYVAPAPSPEFDPELWWLREDSVLPVATEYIKMAAYLLNAYD